MREAFREAICRATGASRLEEGATLQSLWSGYGRIARFHLQGGEADTVVVKLVHVPSAARHPRGWNTSRSHERKLRSYAVELAWYADYAADCPSACRVPRCWAQAEEAGELMMALEDLDAAGFTARRRAADEEEMAACLDWLAAFHARFLGRRPERLWETGTYWHLATRPDELAALEDERLRRAAAAIDERLSRARFQTLVHGDAKLANFCFRPDGRSVAAVDFQYVGGGCGMKDVAYFIGSCLGEEDCERWEERLLDRYFAALRRELEKEGRGAEAAEVEGEWRELFVFAWTDFHRFLKGWSPGHWKLHGYSERLASEALAALAGRRR